MNTNQTDQAETISPLAPVSVDAIDFMLSRTGLLTLIGILLMQVVIPFGDNPLARISNVYLAYVLTTAVAVFVYRRSVKRGRTKA